MPTVTLQSVLGVAYNFVSDQLYAAKKGGGATLNGKPIHVTECKSMLIHALQHANSVGNGICSTLLTIYGYRL